MIQRFDVIPLSPAGFFNADEGKFVLYADHLTKIEELLRESSKQFAALKEKAEDDKNLSNFLDKKVSDRIAALEATDELNYAALEAVKNERDTLTAELQIAREEAVKDITSKQAIINAEIRLNQKQAKEIGRLRAVYQELIMAVGNKYPGESRHETALRYIQKAENGKNSVYGKADALEETTEIKTVGGNFADYKEANHDLQISLLKVQS